MTDIITAHKSFIGRFWMGEVNGKLTCTHLHGTPKAARNCAKRWLAFQNKVEQFKAKQPNQTNNPNMNKPTQIDLTDASPAQLAYLILNGSYGEQQVARRLLEAIAREDSTWNGFIALDALPRQNPNANVAQAFPKGRWT